MKVWEIEYEGHHIKVEGGWFTERLFVDGELQDEQTGLAFRARLFGKIGNDEKSKEIKVSIGGINSLACKIFVDSKLIYKS